MSALAGGRLHLASALATLLAAWLGLQIMRAPLAALTAARLDHDRYARAAESPPPTTASALPSHIGLKARDQAAASAALRSMLAAEAARQGLLIEAAEPVRGAAAAPAEATLAVSGTEAALFRFISAVETASPPVRFRTWRIEQAGGSAALRLSGSALAWWEPAQ